MKLTKGDSLAAQNDVLWISKMYGDAKFADDDEDLESIEIEVDADKLPELMAALRKLASEQGYGNVQGGAAIADASEPQVNEGGESARRISGYLPVEKEGDQLEPAPEAGKAERVKLIIRMK